MTDETEKSETLDQMLVEYVEALTKLAEAKGYDIHTEPEEAVAAVCGVEFDEPETLH